VEIWHSKTSLIPPRFIEVAVPSQESGWSCIFACGIDFCMSLPRFCLFDFGNVRTLWYIFCSLYCSL